MSHKIQVRTVAEGGTGLTTMTSHALQVGNGTSTPTQLSIGATGTLLTGVTGANPAYSATPTLTSLSFGGSAMSTYVQGTYTPVLSFGNASVGITYSTQLGEYTQIGNLVFLTVQIVLTSKGSSTGNAGISLPVNAANGIFTAVAGFYQAITISAGYTTLGIQIDSTTKLRFNQCESSASGASSAVLANGNFANTTQVYLSCIYTIS